MKAFQRILAVLLCLVMSLGMISMVASAATTIETTDENGNPKTGSITIHKYEYNGTTNETNNKGTGLASDASKVPNDANNPDDLTKTAKPLAGVTFTIYQVKDTAETVAYYSGSDSTVLTWDQYANADGSLKVDLGDGINSEETNSNGVTSFTGLNVGIYLVVENTAPGKVTQKAAPFLVSIPMTNPENESEWMYEVHVFPKNKTSVGSVTLNKVDENGIGLAGVTFELKKEVTTEDNKKDYVAVTGDLAAYATRVTEDGGVLTYDNLTPGNYSLTEISAPAGYIVDSRPIYFKVTDLNTIVCTDTRGDCFSMSGEGGKNLSITLKNEKPTFTKEITNNKDIAGVGETVSYKLTVSVPENITAMKSFTVTDAPVGLKVDVDSIVVKDGDNVVPTSCYTKAASGVGFELTFVPATMEEYKGKELTITYNATVTAAAVDAATGKNANEAPNTATLEYNDNLTTNHTSKIEDNEVTKLYNATIIKELKGGAAEDSAVGNVKFVLYKDAAHQTPVYVTGSNGRYKVAESATGASTELVVGADSQIVIDGLGKHMYYLVETQTVGGYNLLSGHVEMNVGVNPENLDENDYTFETTVINKKGFTLPQTGGIGTLMFIIIGGVLMAGGICLIVPNKKRAI